MSALDRAKVIMLIVKPRKAPKTSSKGSAALKALESTKTVQERLLKYFELPSLGFNYDQLEQARLHRDYVWRRDLLVDLANLHDDGFDWFKNKWGRRFLTGKAAPAKADVAEARDQLREVWRRW